MRCSSWVSRAVFVILKRPYLWSRGRQRVNADREAAVILQESAGIFDRRLLKERSPEHRPLPVSTVEDALDVFGVQDVFHAKRDRKRRDHFTVAARFAD